MYNYINGKVAEIGLNTLVLDVGGIGYELNVTSFTLSKCSLGDNVQIFTYLSVKEDDMSLFGFWDKPEKNIFLRLISVSGIGPKMAITILSGISAGEFAASIINSDVKYLTSVKGIGKKTAERIILELRDKVSGEYQASDSITVDMGSCGQTSEEAMLALISLGFTKSEASIRINKVYKDGLSTEQIVMAALKGN